MASFIAQKPFNPFRSRMNHIQVSHAPRTRFLSRWPSAALAAFTLASVSACQFKQPPSCDSEEVQKVLKSVVFNNAKESTIGAPDKDGSGQIKPGSAYFYNNTVLTVSGIFDSGVNKETKVRSCSATMHMKVPMDVKLLAMTASMFGVKTDGVQADQDGGLKAKVDYEVQMDDKGEQFQVQSTSLNSFIGLVSTGHAVVMSKVRWSGRWQGSYRCERAGRADDLAPEIMAAHAPFELAIDEQHLSGNEMLIERNTGAGGFEKLRVQFGNEPVVRLEGANTPRDRWEGQLRGSQRGDKLEVAGLIRGLDDREVARCSMSLELTPLDERFVAEALSEPS
ncbi:hypothetical protein [Diaphorobacter caeni]|uniref:hypothetical protein n=1 Tax=Diaphorobacter caeni TaxID=2784387 RepID=UPI001890019B|nr:hypothetical protein [Diaphorobacter caeni]MBF5004758.1 hypothetical protein [Diaphorobacter caeni]